MAYLAPRVKSVRMSDVLSQLGPARALMYVPGGDPGGGASGGGGGSRSGGGDAGGGGSRSGGGSASK